MVCPLVGLAEIIVFVGISIGAELGAKDDTFVEPADGIIVGFEDGIIVGLIWCDTEFESTDEYAIDPVHQSKRL